MIIVPDFPEPVEGLFFFGGAEQEGRGFDKLSQVGFGVGRARP